MGRRLSLRSADARRADVAARGIRRFVHDRVAPVHRGGRGEASGSAGEAGVCRARVDTRPLVGARHRGRGAVRRQALRQRPQQRRGPRLHGDERADRLRADERAGDVA